MAGFSPKQVLINQTPFLIVQSSLKITGGYGEYKVRTEVFGSTVVQVNSQDLETSKSKVMFDIITKDLDDNTDPRILIKNLKLAGNTNTITVVPDGVGKNQLFANMSLTNDPEVNESPDGVIPFVFEGKQIQLT